MVQFSVTMSRGGARPRSVPCPVHGPAAAAAARPEPSAEYLARLIETNRLCIRIAEEPVSDARLVRKFLAQVMPIFGGGGGSGHNPALSPPPPKCIEIEPHCCDNDDDSRCVRNCPLHKLLKLLVENPKMVENQLEKMQPF